MRERSKQSRGGPPPDARPENESDRPGPKTGDACLANGGPQAARRKSNSLTEFYVGQGA